MTKTLTLIAAAAALLAAGWGLGRWQPAHHESTEAAAPAATAAAAAASAERKVLYWYDPMVPGQKFDKPGKSPFMDMQLVPRYADEEAAESGPALAVSTQAQQTLGLRVAEVVQRPVGAAIELPATVQLNERDVAIVQARTAGFVERVQAHAAGDVVAAGAPLVELLNPEWLGAQQEYLAIKAAGDAALTRAARQRLLLLGMAPALLDRIDAGGQTIGVQTVQAPIGGLIAELMVRQGMTVAPGMSLARINGLATVWLEAALPEAQAAAVQTGQAVQARFAALPGQVIAGRVSALLPEANRETRTLRLRVELANPGLRLRAGMAGQVLLRSAPRNALVVPAEAVIRTGRRTLVYLAEDSGHYRPVEVQLGEQVDEWQVVTAGLQPGQKVVASGPFLLDSEASLQGLVAPPAHAASGAAR